MEIYLKNWYYSILPSNCTNLLDVRQLERNYFECAEPSKQIKWPSCKTFPTSSTRRFSNKRTLSIFDFAFCGLFCFRLRHPFLRWISNTIGAYLCLPLLVYPLDLSLRKPKFWANIWSNIAKTRVPYLTRLDCDCIPCKMLLSSFTVIKVMKEIFSFSDLL